VSCLLGSLFSVIFELKLLVKLLLELEEISEDFFSVMEELIQNSLSNHPTTDALRFLKISFQDFWCYEVLST
jgi:hypothetical protein